MSFPIFKFAFVDQLSSSRPEYGSYAVFLLFKIHPNIQKYTNTNINNKKNTIFKFAFVFQLSRSRREYGSNAIFLLFTIHPKIQKYKNTNMDITKNTIYNFVFVFQILSSIPEYGSYAIFRLFTIHPNIYKTFAISDEEGKGKEAVILVLSQKIFFFIGTILRKSF